MRVRGFCKRWRRELVVAALVIWDIAAFFGSFTFAYWLRFRSPAFAPADGPGFLVYAEAALFFAPVWVAIFARFDLYRTRRTWRLIDLCFTAMSAVSAGMMIFLSVSYLRRTFFYSRMILLMTGGANVLAAGGVRVLLKHLLIWLKDRGIGVRRLVIIGDNEASRKLVDAIERHPELGYSVAGVLRPELDDGVDCPDAAILEGSRQVAAELSRRGTDDVIIAMSVVGNGELTELMASCQESGMRVRVVPHLYELYSSCMELAAVENVPLLAFRDKSLKGEDIVKRLLDVAVAGTALVLAAPALVAAVVTLRIVRKAPVLQRIRLVGREGAPFDRMALAFPGVMAPCSGRRGAGRWRPVRALPALVNVLRGEMSLVGPRPRTAAEMLECNHWQRRRLLARPGLTGLAQIEVPRTPGLSNLEAERDLVYVEQQSTALDLKILLRTAWTLVRGQRWPEDPEPSGRMDHARRGGTSSEEVRTLELAATG